MQKKALDLTCKSDQVDADVVLRKVSQGTPANPPRQHSRSAPAVLVSSSMRLAGENLKDCAHLPSRARFHLLSHWCAGQGWNGDAFLAASTAVYKHFRQLIALFESHGTGTSPFSEWPASFRPVDSIAGPPCLQDGFRTFPSGPFAPFDSRGLEPQGICSGERGRAACGKGWSMGFHDLDLDLKHTLICGRRLASVRIRQKIDSGFCRKSPQSLDPRYPRSP